MARELVWVRPDGDGFPLTNRMAGYRVTKGATGLGHSPIELSSDATPLLDGVEITDVYAPPRTIQLPMLILADTEDSYRARVRALVAALSAGQAGALELRQPDGQTRRIVAWYNGGLEGAEDRDTGGEKWLRFALRLFCPDPFWFNPVPVTYRYEYVGTPTAFLGTPFLPLKLSVGAVIGTTVLTNPGEVLSWPTWVVHPPATELVLTDVDRDLSLTVDASVPGGQTLTIVTEPRSTDVRLSDGTDYWPNLVGSPTLWPVHPGNTNVDLDLVGAGPGSAVDLSFYARYKSPW